LTDEELLEHIRADLAASPFSGEGHRKVWARLRVREGIRVARKRVLRLMREHNLLSPRRSRQGSPKTHQNEIVTSTPNEMWGTDGARILTVKHGWVWLFSAVEHWNGECMGWHLCKRGDRYAALEPISQGLRRVYGSLEADAARGLALRMDHGTQYLSDHFVNQVRFWGIKESYAFLEEPQTNGVAERFNRTLKEQVVYGRVFRDIEELRAAVAAFVETYNREWLLEKNGFLSPLQARQRWFEAAGAQAAA
jgi:transposase InsO family protein